MELARKSVRFALPLTKPMANASCALIPIFLAMADASHLIDHTHMIFYICLFHIYAYNIILLKYYFIFIIQNAWLILDLHAEREVKNILSYRLISSIVLSFPRVFPDIKFCLFTLKFFLKSLFLLSYTYLVAFWLGSIVLKNCFVFYKSKIFWGPPAAG